MELRESRTMPGDGYFLDCMDPGGDTGMSLFWIGPRDWEFLAYATVGYDPLIGRTTPTDTLRAWNRQYDGPHHLLYEDFHLRNTTADKDITPLKVIGAVEQVQYEHRLYQRVFKQEPIEAKHMVTDETLERLGLHLGHRHGQRHVRDCNRHAVTHLTRLRYRPVCEIAYPRRSRTTSRSARPGLLP